MATFVLAAQMRPAEPIDLVLDTQVAVEVCRSDLREVGTHGRIVDGRTPLLFRNGLASESLFQRPAG